nr:amino acid permease [Streptomyces coryli]
MTMIALGGVIGAGLFVSSGQGIAGTGPAIVLAYAIGGALVMLIMRMLGEMSAAHPSSGSFSTHAERAMGPWAGLTAGWMYWMLMSVAVAAQAMGAADIVTGWLPGTEPWMWVAVLMVLVLGANLAVAAKFGEVEYWLAGVKIVAIFLFLALGALAAFGLLGNDAAGTANLTGAGHGFLPHGSDGLITALIASAFAYGGLENATIAAAEGENPRRDVAKAIKTSMTAIAVIYIGSMLVAVTVLPWNDPEVAAKGPFVATLDHLGVPGAGQIMNVVILFALVSAMAACVYGASRMAHSLVERDQGPRALKPRNRAGVPARAVAATCSFGFAAVLLAYWFPDTLFKWLLNMVGATVLVVWGFIAVAQLRLRRRYEREAPEQLTVKMWAFPYLTWLALAAIAAILVLMARTPNGRAELITTGATAIALSALGLLRDARRRRRAPAA